MAISAAGVKKLKAEADSAAARAAAAKIKVRAAKQQLKQVRKLFKAEKKAAKQAKKRLEAARAAVPKPSPKPVEASTPAAPWRLRAETEPKEIVLSWQPSEAPDVVYLVYWDAKRGSERPIGSTAKRTFRVSGAATQERHCYQVAALDGSARESPRTFPVCAQLRRSLASADARTPSPDQP